MTLALGNEKTRTAAVTLAHEAMVVLVAAGKMLKDRPLDWDDYVRLAQAEQRIADAKAVLDE